MLTKINDSEKLEDLIYSFKNETDNKKKHVIYLQLVEESLKLVKKIAHGVYTYSGVISRDDLIQVGAIGALKAIDTYHIEEKGSFKTYASKFIKGKILQFLRDKATLVKIPRESSSNISLVKEALENLGSNLGSTPTVAEIAQYTKLQEEKVQEILDIEIIRNTISLDQNIYTIEGTETLLDRIQDKENNNYEKSYENKKVIEYALEKLPKQENYVIKQYYIEGLTKKDIAKNMNISATQVARLLKRALNKMYIIINQELKGE